MGFKENSMPIRPTNVDRLTDFQKNAKAILAELEATGPWF